MHISSTTAVACLFTVGQALYMGQSAQAPDASSTTAVLDGPGSHWRSDDYYVDRQVARNIVEVEGFKPPKPPTKPPGPDKPPGTNPSPGKPSPGKPSPGKPTPGKPTKSAKPSKSAKPTPARPTESAKPSPAKPSGLPKPSPAKPSGSPKPSSPPKSSSVSAPSTTPRSICTKRKGKGT